MTHDVLSDAERRTLDVVCATFIPPEPEADASRRAVLTAHHQRLVAAMQQALATLGADQRSELRLFLRLLANPVFMLATTGRRGGLQDLEADDREAALLSLANSRIPQLRTGYQALKRLTTFLAYSITDPSGSNPNWAGIGYDVPAPPPASSPLDVTIVTRPTTIDADACVIGSGAGGGVVAARLAAAGRRVVVLEAGPPDQAADFDQHEIVGMQRLYLDQGTTATKDLGVAILAGSCVGGGTTVNWQTSLALPDYIRDEWAERSGLRTFVQPEFGDAMQAVSARIAVSTDESVPNANNAALGRGGRSLGYDLMSIPRNSRGCDLSQCGFCVFGCRVGGKQSTASTFLVDAQRTGTTSIIASCRAERVLVENGRAVGVVAYAPSPATGERIAVRVNAPLVACAAGAIETPALLMRSGVEHAQLGRNLFLHPTTAVAGRYPDHVRGWHGAPQSVLCNQLARAHGNYGVRFETAPLHPGLIGLALPWYGGQEHRSLMRQAAHVAAFIVLTRDHQGGRVRVGRDGRAVMTYRLRRPERALMQRGIAAAARIHHAAGADAIHTLHVRDYSFDRSVYTRAADFEAYCDEIGRLPVHGNRCAVFSAHQMGTCRMGSVPKTSVCDERGQVHGIRGLHVADASLFPASSGVNPMITIMALAYLVGGRIAA